MKWRLWQLLPISLSLLAVFWSLGISAAQAQPVFRIAVLDQERGAATSGARLAVQEINLSGGVEGADGTRFSLELIIVPPAEDGSLVDALATVAQSDVIAVIGPVTTNEVLNNAPALQGLGVPVITTAIGDTILATDTSGRLFRSRAAEVLQGRALADTMINTLGLRSIATVQLDVDSTAGIIGFSGAAQTFGVQPQPALLLTAPDAVEQIVDTLIDANPAAVVVYGPPEIASQLYTELRQAEYGGSFAYNQAESAAFRDAIPLQQLNGILAVTTWAFSAADQTSAVFRDSYVRTFGEVPTAVAAAAYDTLNLLAEAIGLPGELQANLRQINGFVGVQGLLRPALLGRGELSDNVAVTQIGAFGAPQVIARYLGTERLPDDPSVAPTEAPLPTATLDGVVVTVENQIINVRSGPSTSYEILGQLAQGEQARVIGTSRDLQWVVINFRGTQGWMFADLLLITGDLRSVPIIDPPPTPTPPPATATPTAAPVADIVIDTAVPSTNPILPNTPFTINVTVRNAGALPAGQFAIAATFPPNNIFSSAFVSSLAPGATAVVALTGTFTNTGTYSVVIVTDLNNEVNEGTAGEGYNNFNFTYRIDRATLVQGTRTLNPGENFDFEGNGVNLDVTWNAGASALDILGTARLGIIAGVDVSTVHYDLVNPSIINQTTIPRTSLNPGIVVGIITADGNRGVLRVDGLPGNQFQFTYRIYVP